MKVELKQVTADEKEILKNLLEKYDYEFSQWDQRDVNKLGLYGYEYLDYYWTENKRWAYFILVDDKLAGFAMVIDLPEVDDRPTDFQMAEFFVMYKYRRSGVGKEAFFKVLDNHKGRWQLKRHPANLPSVHFWNNVISEYTNGQYELVEAYPRTEYDDGTLADVFFFES
ncbi:MAG TPA: GNAT family N-acetyltransferase [Lachnoclostridium phytofermentans]|uniref:GNAT family N-acetyltransferase n=1 Tax=Lachnoclostridium phytofermentans TaxID=66219 RepID=A0A3D2X753_9FIRM|nr:GNAT family N-acetyltransferase [Lachnoclostridium sp.]HCL02980.1 GNAT family N-acetyltransferase [Lachnoclostridium phytofermentans]